MYSFVISIFLYEYRILTAELMISEKKISKVTEHLVTNEDALRKIQAAIAVYDEPPTTPSKLFGFSKVRVRGYKTYFVLNTVEHEIFPANKC